MCAWIDFEQLCRENLTNLGEQNLIRIAVQFFGITMSLQSSEMMATRVSLMTTNRQRLLQGGAKKRCIVFDASSLN